MNAATRTHDGGQPSQQAACGSVASFPGRVRRRTRGTDFPETVVLDDYLEKTMTRSPSIRHVFVVHTVLLCGAGALLACRPHRSPPAGVAAAPAPPTASATLPDHRKAPSVDNTARDSAASVSFVIAGTPKDSWNFVNDAVQDTVFRLLGSNSAEGWMRDRSIARGLILDVALVPHGSDSTQLVISGQQYAGNSGRPGVTLLGGDHWPVIVTGEPAVVRLQEEAIRIREGIDRARRTRAERLAAYAAGGSGPEAVALIEAPVSHDSLVRVLSDGKLGYCRRNTFRADKHLDSLLIVDVQNRPEWCPIPAYLSVSAFNTFILVDPRTIAIGDTISACARFGSPRHYVLISEAAYADPKRCPDSAGDRKPLEPNMKIVRREQ